MTDEKNHKNYKVLRRARSWPATSISLPRSVAVEDDFWGDDGAARPTLPAHDYGLRPDAVGHGHGAETPPTMSVVEPDDWARGGAVNHANSDGTNAAGRGDVDNGVDRAEPRMVAPDHGFVANVGVEPVVKEPESVVEKSPDAKPDIVEPVAVSPPLHADLVTVEEAVSIFSERGLPRHMRTIQKYCSRKTGRVLVCYQMPTENGIRDMIERQSIDRFIGDAAQQAPTGKLEPEPMVAPIEREVASAPAVEIPDIFEHPFVQRLEA